MGDNTKQLKSRNYIKMYQAYKNLNETEAIAISSKRDTVYLYKDRLILQRESSRGAVRSDISFKDGTPKLVHTSTDILGTRLQAKEIFDIQIDVLLTMYIGNYDRKAIRMVNKDCMLHGSAELELIPLHYHNGSVLCIHKVTTLDLVIVQIPLLALVENTRFIGITVTGQELADGLRETHKVSTQNIKYEREYQSYKEFINNSSVFTPNNTDDTNEIIEYTKIKKDNFGNLLELQCNDRATIDLWDLTNLTNTGLILCNGTEKDTGLLRIFGNLDTPGINTLFINSFNQCDTLISLINCSNIQDLHIENLVIDKLLITEAQLTSLEDKTGKYVINLLLHDTVNAIIIVPSEYSNESLLKLAMGSDFVGIGLHYYATTNMGGTRTCIKATKLNSIRFKESESITSKIIWNSMEDPNDSAQEAIIQAYKRLESE